MQTPPTQFVHDASTPPPPQDAQLPSSPPVLRRQRRHVGAQAELDYMVIDDTAAELANLVQGVSLQPQAIYVDIHAVQTESPQVPRINRSLEGTRRRLVFN